MMSVYKINIAEGGGVYAGRLRRKTLIIVDWLGVKIFAPNENAY